ncbi:MAG TPA: TetR/AcrR family transcriptional regulator [Clostridiaceae bacterium]|nr:TetR/AcrR family transcriptional regulator [Clostridiaceae bacterium]
MFDQSAEFNNIITDDPRILRTKKSLYRSLCSLLKEKPLSQITISEITKKSKINRSTFYLHYTNLLDLQNEIEENLFRIYKTSLDNYLTSLNLHDNNSVNEEYGKFKMIDLTPEINLYENTFRFLQKYKQYAPILLAESPNNKLLENIIALGFEAYFAKWKSANTVSDSLYFKYSYPYIVNGLIAVCRLWLSDGMKESPAQMAEFAIRFSAKNMR